MKIKVFGSGSKGNGYLIDDTLLLEVGTNSKDVLKSINYDINKIKAVLITHSHIDHAKYIKDWVKLNIPIYATQGTFEELNLSNNHNLNIIKYNKLYQIENYIIYVFETYHDTKEPCGFIIINQSTNEKLLFATDTYLLKESFKGLDYMLVECNYIEKIIENYSDDNTSKINRLYASHMSLESLEIYFNRQDISTLKNVMLIHLSDSNSDKKQMIDTVKNIVRCNVFTAEKGIYNFEKNPF
jgi:phosphoribosyl 1,2-cyclic phosphodiesterase